MTSYVKNGTCYEKENISKCISDHAEQLLSTQHGSKIKLGWHKKGDLVKQITEKR